ncbi:MAG: sigma-70 family RNA polymerase sigma factor [Anaerolineales bacterium]|nr:MAG: sigma-70 family RNA polymerase sigma factor [Anaerolineales bacterium]
MHSISREDDMLTFDELYNSYAQDVYRFAYWLSGNRMDAEDITSETFVRAWLRFSSIRMETLKGYLFKIARNVFLTKQRKGQPDTALVDTYPDPTPGPERMAHAHITLAAVRTFLQTLPEGDRTAFVLRVQYDLPYAEIARVLEVSEVSARVKVHRARKLLLLRRIGEEIE